MNINNHYSYRHRNTLLNKKRRKRFILIFSLSLFLIIFFIILFNLKYFYIKNINIYGVEQEKITSIENQIENYISGRYFYLFPKKNFLLIPKDTIAKNIYENNFFIKDVKIYLEDINTLAVEIKERDSNVVWCNTNESCYFLDNGFAYAQAPKFTDLDIDKFIILRSEQNNINNILGSVIVKPEIIRKISTFISFLDRRGVKAPYVLLKKYGDIEIHTKIHTKNGVSIIFNDSQEISQIIENLSSVINSGTITKGDDELDLYSILLYIDLRFGNRVFYKFK